MDNTRSCLPKRCLQREIQAPMPYPIVMARLRQTARIAFVLTMALLSCWLMVAIVLFQLLPSSRPGENADAVIVLAGSPNDRVPLGIMLVESGIASTLAISTVSPDFDNSGLCPAPRVSDARILCFSPNPVNTRGESIGAAELIRDNNWTRVVVVTSRYHVVRAGVLVAQCTSAEIEVVASEPGLTLIEWLHMAVEESAGLIDALVRPQCN
jgi:uncharacterized SAM-binding protein YcdF (DUF218 family)